MKQLATRRLFLMTGTKSLIAFTGLLALPGLSHSAILLSQSPEHVLRSLIRLLEDLFPHKDLSKQVYIDAGKMMLRSLSQSSNDDRLLQEGIAQLDAMAHDGDWSALTEQQRLSILENIQDTTFFSVLRNTAVQSIYRDPRVWARVGYGGNALQQGGYLTRGFNDIDWLPE